MSQMISSEKGESVLHAAAEPTDRRGITRRVGCWNAGKTATTPVLMSGAWVRASSIGRIGALEALCEAAASAAADTACLGCGSATKTQVRPTVLRTPLYGSWDRLCSLVVEGCRGALG